MRKTLSVISLGVDYTLAEQACLVHVLICKGVGITLLKAIVISQSPNS